jgi:hypothetical protein
MKSLGGEGGVEQDANLLRICGFVVWAGFVVWDNFSVFCCFSNHPPF